MSFICNFMQALSFEIYLCFNIKVGTCAISNIYNTHKLCINFTIFKVPYNNNKYEIVF